MIFVGDDWAESHHDVHVMNEGGERLAARRLPEGLEGIRRLHELLADLVEDPGDVVIGIETDRGLWVHALAAAGYEVYAINPLAAARYRERHNVGGAKSDAGDAKVLADLVRTDRHNHRPIAADSPGAEAVKVLATEPHLGTQPPHQSAAQCPARVLPGGPRSLLRPGRSRRLAVLGRAPTPARARPCRSASSVRRCKRAGRQRNLDRRAGEIQVALRGEHLAAPAALAVAFAATTKAAVGIIAELNRQIAELETALADHFEQHPDADIYLSLPGLGDVLGARVLGEFGDAPDRYASAKSRKNYAGTSPLTVASGKKRPSSPDTSATDASMTPSTNGRSARCQRVPAAGPTTTSDGPPGTSTTRRCGRSGTVLSASSTAVSQLGPTMTKSRPGRTAIGAIPTSLLDQLRPWGV